MNHAVGPSVNLTLMIELNFEKYIKNFKINFLLLKLFKIQYNVHLRSKNYKIMSKNPIHQGLLPRRIKIVPPSSLKILILFNSQ
jgi:hypothetical protein